MKFLSTIKGDIDGTATKAVRDASGNVITDTYATNEKLDSFKQDIGDTEIDFVAIFEESLTNKE